MQPKNTAKHAKASHRKGTSSRKGSVKLASSQLKKAQTAKIQTKDTKKSTAASTPKTEENFKIFRGTLRKLNPQAVRLVLITTIMLAASFGAAYNSNGVNAADGSNGGLLRRIARSQGRITASGPAQNDGRFSTYPTWSQDFAHYKSKKIDSQYWGINIGAPQNGNNEAEYYTDNPTNLNISDASLVMRATRQPEPGNLNYASARVDTQGKVSFLYGRVDVVAKLPNSVGTWPAVWLLPATTKYEDLSPDTNAFRFLNGGEMDLIEEVGINPNIEYGVVHTVTSNHNNPNGVGDFNQVYVPNNNSEYNKYSLLWTPTTITFEVNDTPFFTYQKQPGADYTTWPFDQPFYLIMNLALGGVWGGQDTVHFPGNGIDNSALPATMQIQSVFYYPYLTK